MEQSFNCPICESNNWIESKKYYYEYESSLQDDNDSADYRSKFLKKRRHILFDLWFPNQKKIKLSAIYCKSCGFMCYSPRPEKIDLQSKYEFLSKRGSIGILSEASPKALKLDDKRAAFIKNKVEKYRKDPSNRALDVGGGDGRLLRLFLEEGYKCFLIDFNLKPYPGIERIGSTFDDIKQGEVFDVIICSHVLEHVSDPGIFLRQLSSFLSKNGVAFVEVPLEIWEGIPISNDPVTHINYFTEKSLEHSLLLNNLQPLAIESKYSSYDGYYKRVAWSVASSSDIKTPLNKLNSNSTTRLLQPGLIRKLYRKAENFWLNKILN